RARLLTDHEVGIPIRPVHIVHADLLLMDSVRSRGSPQCRGKFVRGGECRVRAIDAPGQSRRDLLKQPAVAVGIVERGIGAVAAMFRIGTADPEPSEEEGFVRSGIHAAAIVEYVTDLDAAAE